ncbi:MAG TPA: hypothetical protein ENN65_02700, partial [Candidatus Hydrogenedentes bacterium]|nr:hypothetical protein [Candidatus Hydrogenedentota bacterium]
TSKIVLNAVLPVIKVMVEDDPAIKKAFAGVSGRVQFRAEDANGPVGACLVFDNGAFSVEQGIADNPDLLFAFPSLKKMNDMFRGKPTALPQIGPLLSGLFSKPGLLINTFRILLGMKILMPTAKPKDPAKARLKVKMTLYMVSTALSQMNKAGDPEMSAWTAKQPERIYQWSVDGEDIACHLKVKAGKTKAGRGVYTRRQPFVHMRFSSIENALPVLANDVDTVTAIGKGWVTNDGSPEYGGRIGDFMMRIANLLA